MKYGLAALPSLCILLFASAALAGEPIVYEGVDITPAVEFFKTRIYTTNREFKTYNYSRTGPLPAGISPLELTRRRSLTFWQNFAKTDLDNIWGQGLYLAVDPVVTVKYGGGEGDARSLANFKLTEMNIPLGTRVLMLNESDPVNEAAAAMREIAAKFDCDPKTETMFLFFWAAFQSKERCIAFTRTVFKDILAPDLLVYSYSQAQLQGCDHKRSGDAFVVLRGDRFREQDIKIYDRTTTAHVEDRRLIQTLFTLENRGWSLFTPSTLTERQMRRSLARAPLWKDLIGQPLARNAQAWLTRNHYSCGGRLPFIETDQLK